MLLSFDHFTGDRLLGLVRVTGQHSTLQNRSGFCFHAAAVGGCFHTQSLMDFLR